MQLVNYNKNKTFLKNQVYCVNLNLIILFLFIFYMINKQLQQLYFLETIFLFFLKKKSLTRKIKFLKTIMVLLPQLLGYLKILRRK